MRQPHVICAGPHQSRISRPLSIGDCSLSIYRGTESESVYLPMLHVHVLPDIASRVPPCLWHSTHEPAALRCIAALNPLIQ